MSDVIAFVKKYLATQGYPFEMFVAKTFRNEGFNVIQSRMYLDPVTEKYREIDVTAYLPIIVDDVQVTFQVIIECKFAKTPWVLFGSEDDSFDILPPDQMYACNKAGQVMLRKLHSIPEFNLLKWFCLWPKRGYGLIETSSQNKVDDSTYNTPHKAISTILNAVVYEKKNISPLFKEFRILIPIIAIKGKLCDCFLDQDNKEVINEISEGQLIYKGNIEPGVYPIIEIVTDSHIEQLAKKIKSDCTHILHTYKSNLKEIFDTYPSDFADAEY